MRNSDERGACRVYEMSIGNGEWKLWREGKPFSQRFTATFSDDGQVLRERVKMRPWRFRRTARRFRELSLVIGRHSRRPARR